MINGSDMFYCWLRELMVGQIDKEGNLQANKKTNTVWQKLHTGTVKDWRYESLVLRYNMETK